MAYLRFLPVLLLDFLSYEGSSANLQCGDLYYLRFLLTLRRIFLHRFYSVQFLAALLLGVVAQDNNNSKTPPLSSPNRGGKGKIVYCLPFMLLVITHLIITSHLLVQRGHYTLALFAYPLNIEAHEKSTTPFSQYLFRECLLYKERSGQLLRLSGLTITTRLKG